MLTESRLELVLSRIPRLILGVVGDLFLDRYLDIDSNLTEPSLETGLDAYQVVGVRSYPGAAGTVVNNLVTLGVRRVHVVSVIGDDGEGYELRRALQALGCVDCRWLFASQKRRTPTYTKPMLQTPHQSLRELNRLDIKNRSPLPQQLEQTVLIALEELWPQVDALLVLDQVSEEDCGVVSAQVRQRLAEFGQANPNKLILADSRKRIGKFSFVSLKPNRGECMAAADCETPLTLEESAIQLAWRAGRPVFCTCGEQGTLVAEPCPRADKTVLVPAYPVAGPIDIVGAGDSTSAGIACAIGAGATLEEAAAFGNLVASITIQQIGVTGAATPDQVRQRWREVAPL